VANNSPAKFGLYSIILLGINSVIGSGIFLLPGQVMALVGTGSILVYLFVTVVVAAMALCFAECAGIFSRNGAAYVYAKEAFGDFVGFEVGFMRWAVTIIAWATLVMGFITALSAIWPAALQEPYKTTLVVGIVGGLGIMNILGINIMKHLNNMITIAKLIPLIFLIAIGVFFIHGSNLTPMIPKEFHPDAFGAAALVIFFAFSGFETLAVAAEDMENPRKNLPIALLVVIAFTAVVYFLIQMIAMGTLGNSLASSSAPVADVADSILGPAGKWIVTIGTLVSIGGINIAQSFTSPRSGVALAQDKMVPEIIAQKSRFGTPYVSILITVGLTILVSLSGSFMQLAVISVISRFAEYLPTCCAVFVFQKRKMNPNSFLAFPWTIIVPLTAIIPSILLLMEASPDQLFWGLGALLIGVPLYFWRKMACSNPTPSQVVD
jgi:amino acid transporter